MPDYSYFLALGDSYTIGTGVDPADSWPVQLTEQLRVRGVTISNPLIIAKNGWTTGSLLSVLDEDNIPQDFDLVSLLIGVNDQYDGISPKKYQRNFRDLLKQVVKFSSTDPARLMVLSIPDWSMTPFAEGRDRAKIAAQIEHFNAINHQEAELAGARYIEISCPATDDFSFFAEDGLHPSGKMYTTWVERLLPTVIEILQA